MLGPYRVTAPIGAGGMGEVYRARDTKLDRDVAVKILSEEFAHDADRLARFTREAKTLAALSHPHIAGIHGLEESSGITALVMELVEGDDLSQRIAFGAIPLDEALPIAKQIAEALEAAHEQGIIHRDLKPANIKVRPDGTVKVLDFGLAKAPDPPAGSSPNVSQSPTLSMHATQAGVILGTAAYMSPEQARGHAVDKRADIWAFGVVFLEMISGRALFRGESVTDTLAAVLTRSIDLSDLPPSVPAPIRALIRRCLERDPKRRLRDIGEARLTIDEVVSGHPEASSIFLPTTSGRSHVTSSLTGAALGLAIGVLAAGLAARAYFPQAQREETRLDIATPPMADAFSFALSADGRQVAFVAADRRMPQLWIRRFDSAEARALPNTDGASHPFWSPDGGSIGFFADGKLKRMALDGSRPTVLAEAPSARGASWGSQDEILMLPTVGVVHRVAASGGTPIPVTRLAAGDTHRAPQWLPDGRRFLYYIHSGSPDRRGIYLATLDQPEGTRLVAADSGGQYRPPGQLVYVKDGTLMAQTVDLEARVMTGQPMTIASNIAVDMAVSGKGAFSVSATGPVAYRTGLTNRRLMWLNPANGATETITLVVDGTAVNPRVSQDGRRVLLRQVLQGDDDVWMIDLGRGALTRATFNPASESFPVWSPDARQFAFRSNRFGTFGLFVKPANGESDERQLLATGEDLAVTDWSPDGRWLLYYAISKAGRDLWVLPMAGADKGTPVPFLRTQFDEASGEFSPDGRWIAYQTNESGAFNIAVRPFPGPGGVWHVSSEGGGVQPRWSPDGKALYYLTLDGRFMSVPVTVRADSIDLGASRALWGTRLSMTNSFYLNLYDVGPDGRLLIVATPESDAGVSSPIRFVLDWKGPTL